MMAGWNLISVTAEHTANQSLWTCGDGTVMAGRRPLLLPAVTGLGFSEMINVACHAGPLGEH